MATILPTETVTDYKPAPTIAYFSARGPSYATKNILKVKSLLFLLGDKKKLHTKEYADLVVF